MHQIDTPGSENGLFSNGNPALNIEGTIADADWLNAVQETLRAPMLAANLAIEKGDHTLLMQAIQLIAQAVVGTELIPLVNLTTPYDVVVGEGIREGVIFGVATAAVTAGNVVSSRILGQHLLPKDPAESVLRGQIIYWDTPTRRVTAIPAPGRLPIGAATLNSPPPVAIARVRLSGSHVPAVP